MADSIKNQVTADIQKAKEEGQLRSERVKEIVNAAVSKAAAEFKEGSVEIRTIAKDAVSAVIENLKERGGEIKEEVTASIEGAIEAISSARRQSIAKTQDEVKKLQAQIDAEETELQTELDTVLMDIEETGKDTSAETKASIESAINTIKDSEEVFLLRKRYAQLQTQLAIIQANLSARYGERYGEVKKYLDDAKNWYEKTQPKAEVVADQVKQKRTDFETKLGEAGTALAKKEQRVRQLLKELWHSVTEVSDEK
ncbi:MULTISPECIES: histidine kinase [unclassified Coleofasciculus]|uniref:histidine kinase n=1 Tax=unclassified Coleofasciculus TaxID=2692782 RepID=UPI0018809BF9|nr:MULTISPECIES: histidine kinase [unclassified Coleofasciculus]MBE9124788.1 histidine kinase [Coleofasciculus sp. LEGE 07081]MBE9147692.1 histidine kinase [Coleofasciculus sp. LEGE 07092]